MKNVALMTLPIVLSILSGCATQESVQSHDIQLRTLEERMTSWESRIERVERSRAETKMEEATRYCFNNGQAFSEGSIYAGRICQRQSGMVTFVNGKSTPAPLVWSAWKYQ